MENKNIKPEIIIDDIDKLDIRIGLVISADLIEGTELIEQRVDFLGEIGVKTIVSKIAKYYLAEDIIGKCYPYVLNLPPRKIRGILSEGMIVAVEEIMTNKMHLLQTEAIASSIVF